MAKFVSYDGMDKNGVRAEVTVQTGTGRVKEIIGRGKPNDDGSYRNVEVVFDPDNPLLKRKVYGLLDTNAAELWAYVQQAQADGRTVSYRIESQRRNGVPREIPVAELTATEQVRRLIASVDGHFSHEAKTNPAEDPDGENPSALGAPLPVAGAAGQAPASPQSALAALAAARRAEMPAATVDVLAGLALAAGATVADVRSAGLDASAADAPVPASRPGHAVATEERPWVQWNSDGRINFGSYAVARAAEAEQFALDHLISVYTPPKSKTPIDVTDEIIAQAASVAVQVLEIADRVQVAASGRADRQKASHARALALVTDAIAKRYPVPVGGTEPEQAAWAESVATEASERMRGLASIAQGRSPGEPAAEAAVFEERTVDGAGLDAAISSLGGTVLADTRASFRPEPHPMDGEPGFQEPDPELVGRLRAMCERARVAHDTRAISDWIERVVGVRSARKVHAPVLEAFCDHYEQAGVEQIRAEVASEAAA